MRTPWNIKGRRGDGDWRKVAVYGYGASGCAATAFLRARDVEVVVLDLRPAAQLEAPEQELDPGIRWHLGEEPGGAVADQLLKDLDGVVVSPGVPGDRPLLAAARDRGLPIIAEVGLAFPFLAGRVVGITGSNGKSTTTAMTGAMLRQAGHRAEICGNIGVPLCSLVDSTDGGADRFFVVELSSFQLDSIELFRPAAAALLNLSDDHLDRHRDRAGYRDAKARIFMRQQADDTAILNADDSWVANLPVPSRRRSFSRLAKVADGCHATDQAVLEALPGCEPRALFLTDDVPVAGPHNLENAMAAALLARACGVGADDIATALRLFRGLPHRLERIAHHRGVTWYDDSKGTNVGATLRSLEGFPDGTVHLILGGRNKGADFRPLRSLVAKKARRVYLIGETSAELEAVLGGAEGEPALCPDQPGTELIRAETLDNAVRLAAGEARFGDVVLLSPACASFDQFRSFVERGQVFQRLVRAVTGGEDG